jgi:hypothetical protein
MRRGATHEEKARANYNSVTKQLTTKLGGGVVLREIKHKLNRIHTSKYKDKLNRNKSENFKTTQVNIGIGKGMKTRVGSNCRTLQRNRKTNMHLRREKYEINFRKQNNYTDSV